MCSKYSAKTIYVTMIEVLNYVIIERTVALTLDNVAANAMTISYIEKK